MLLLTLEGFTPAALSCYGSSWNRTEAIDTLSSIGTTWDRVITPLTDPLALLDRWLSCEKLPAADMVVVTDDERLGRLPSADAIGELIVVPQSGNDCVANSMEETTLASLVAIAAEQLPDNPHVWLHSRFLTRRWDAPRDLFPVDQLDEPDLAPLDASESLELEMELAQSSVADDRSGVPGILPDWRPPHFSRQPSDDPDLVMAWMRTYGCQIRLVDALFGLLHSVAGETGHKAIVLAGTSGFSLGQNAAIGHRTGPLRSCHLHVPLIAATLNEQSTVTDADRRRGAMGIRNRDVTSADSLPEVIAAITIHPRQSPVSPETWAAKRDHELASEQPGVVTRHGDQAAAITTQDWFYVAAGVQADRDNAPVDETQDSLGHLFLKPDDSCDINDVARLKAETATQLFHEMSQPRTQRVGQQFKI